MGAEFRVSQRQPFCTLDEGLGGDYDLNSDGTRLLLMVPHDPEGEDAATRISVSVTLNWLSEITAQP